MKFKCPICGRIIARDVRKKITKMFLTKRGYKAICPYDGKMHFCKPVLKNQ